MAVIIPAGYGVAAIKTRTLGDPEPMVWTCGFDLTDMILDANAPEFISDAWDASLKTITSSAVSLIQVDVKVGPTVTGPIYTWVGDIDGTDAGALLPPNCAVLVQKRTGLGGRMNRGRMYLPGISSIDGQIDSGGNILPGGVAPVQSAVDAFFTFLNTSAGLGTMTPVLLHSASSDPTPVASFVVADRLATQRRRMRP